MKQFYRGRFPQSHGDGCMQLRLRKWLLASLVLLLSHLARCLGGERQKIEKRLSGTHTEGCRSKHEFTALDDSDPLIILKSVVIFCLG